MPTDTRGRGRPRTISRDASADARQVTEPVVVEEVASATSAVSSAVEHSSIPFNTAEFTNQLIASLTRTINEQMEAAVRNLRAEFQTATPRSAATPVQSPLTGTRSDPVAIAHRNKLARVDAEIARARINEAVRQPVNAGSPASDNSSINSARRVNEPAYEPGYYPEAEYRRNFESQSAARPQAYAQVKAPKRPTFKREADPYSFIERILQYGREMGLHLDQLFYDILPQCFEEDTTQGWFQRSRYNWRCWQDFVNDLYQSYTKPELVRALSVQAVTVCMRPDEDPLEFALRKDEQLCRYMPQFTAALRIKTIVNLSAPHYRAQLAQRTYEDFAELKKALIHFREVYSDSGRLMPTKASTDPSEVVETFVVQPRKKSYSAVKTTEKDSLPKAKVSGYFKQRKPDAGVAQHGFKPAERSARVADKAKEVVCYRCHRAGHFANKCPNPPVSKEVEGNE